MSRFLLKETVRVAGGILPATPIDFAGMANELWSARSCDDDREGYVRIATDLVVQERSGAAALLPSTSPLRPADQNVRRHLPWVKLRVASCGSGAGCKDADGTRDPSGRPVWMDTGQSVVVPWQHASAALISSDDFLQPSNGVPIPPDGPEHFTLDAWLWVTMERTDCCEPSCVLLTDSVLLSPEGAEPPLVSSVRLIVPPRARTLTIHKGAGAGLDVTWRQADLQIGTSGLPAAASQVVLTVPDLAELELVNLSAQNGIDVGLVWGLQI